MDNFRAYYGLYLMKIVIVFNNNWTLDFFYKIEDTKQTGYLIERDYLHERYKCAETFLISLFNLIFEPF